MSGDGAQRERVEVEEAGSIADDNEHQAGAGFRERTLAFTRRTPIFPAVVQCLFKSLTS